MLHDPLRGMWVAWVQGLVYAASPMLIRGPLHAPMLLLATWGFAYYPSAREGGRMFARLGIGTLRPLRDEGKLVELGCAKPHADEVSVGSWVR